MRLLRIGSMGHVGVPTAFAELEAAYAATQTAPGDTEKKARAEVKRMITNRRGISLILNDPTPEEDRGCRCGMVLTDEDILAILEGADELTQSDVREMVGAERYDAVAAANGHDVAPTETVVHPPATNGTAHQLTVVTPISDVTSIRTALGNNGAAPAKPAAETKKPASGEKPQRPVPPLHSYSTDDVGNGQRFIAVWGDDVAWVPDVKATYVWTGTRWEVDTGARMRHLAEVMTDYTRTEAKARLCSAQKRHDTVADLPNDDPAKQKAKAELEKSKKDVAWVVKSRMGPKLNESVKSAVSHPGTSIRSGQWDNDERLLNLANGTIRLELDGEHTFHAHRREDRLTQQSATTYDAQDTTPVFTDALERWLQNPAVRRVVRALAGISLQGNNSRHKFPCLVGKPRSGKTPLAEVIAAVLDNPDERGISYSGSFKLADLRPQSNGASPNASLFRIVRRRYVYCSESNDGGTPLSADLMKRFSGGDRQQARDTYGKASGIDDRPPAFTPWLATNKTPEVEGADAALRERIIAIWFEHTIPVAERDGDLPEKLKAEHSGILNWMLDGYRDAVQNPSVLTDLPAECIDAAEKMYQAMNVYQRWMAEETVPSDNKAEWILVDGRFGSWEQFTGWCAGQRETSGTKWKFGNGLAELGHPSKSEWIPAEEGQIGPGGTKRVRVGLAWSEQHHQRIAEELARFKAEKDEQDAGGFGDHG
jgi:putative DNA primase/helicase